METNSESLNLKKTVAQVFQQCGTVLLNLDMDSRKERKAIREMAKCLAQKILQNINYDFKSYPTPIHSLVKYLNIKEEESNKVQGDAKLYKRGSEWVVTYRKGIGRERNRFSLAHEIGHILTDYAFDSFITPNQYAIEEFCNMIAVELIAPSAIFQSWTLDDVLKDMPDRFRISSALGRLPKLNFALFELIRKRLCVSRFVLVKQLHWTKFINDSESAVIISEEAVNRCTGRTPGLRAIYTASPTWGFILPNKRLNNMGLFSAVTAFNILGSGEVQTWCETVRVKEKRDGKWLDNDVLLDSYGEHVVFSFSGGKKYLLTTLSWKE